MRKTIIIAALICSVTISFAFIKDTKPRYENLKVLPKNTDKHQMDSIMKHFSQSLGVKCTYCHVRGNDEQKNFDFASDANDKKLIARQMFKMTNKINKKYFDEGNDNKGMPAISCYSCHHGQEDPENRPPAPAPRQ